MGVAQQFAVNTSLEKQGTPFRCQPNPDGTIPTLYIARTFRDSTEYRKVFERVSKPYKNALDRDELSEEDDRFIATRTFAEVSVKGWDNMRLPQDFAGIGRGEDAADHDIPFSVDACAALLRHPQMHDLFKQAAAISVNPDNYREGALDAAVKNS